MYTCKHTHIQTYKQTTFSYILKYTSKYQIKPTTIKRKNFTLNFTAWPANNISNLLRNVVLWLWGGLNSDTDCICVRNVTHIHNMVSYDEEGKVANNAIMHFDAGHPFTYELMKYLKENFKVSAECFVYDYINVILSISVQIGGETR